MLTVAAIRSAAPQAKDYKLSDSGGLFLLVKTSGYKSWRLKYRFAGKEKQLTFGAFPDISLKEARDLRDAAKRDLREAKDPGRLNRQRRDIVAGRHAEDLTFKGAALRWHAVQAASWKPKHAKDVLHKLEQEVFPAIGHLRLDRIGPADIRPVIEAIGARGAVDQAHRTLTRISRIFRLAIVEEKTATDPAAGMSAILPPVVIRKYRAIVSADVARTALLSFESEAHWPTTKLASRLLALTAARPGPLRFAQPEEFHDLDGGAPAWIIPAAKMKLDRAQSEQDAFEFVIPLSKQAAAAVAAALTFSSGRKYLFPSAQFPDRPISENALNIAYRRSPAFMGRHVPHGWRSTFSTIMNERAAELDRPGDRAIIDLMLAHKPRGVEGIYNRAAYMPRRRVIAQEWADLLTGSGAKALTDPVTLLEGPRN